MAIRHSTSRPAAGRPPPDSSMMGGRRTLDAPEPPNEEHETTMSDKPRDMPIKIPEDVLGGVYANQMVVQHTREEFVLDFVNVFPPGGVVNARVIVSPGHMKRMVRALAENLRKYEDRFGAVAEASLPDPTQFN